MKGDMPRGCGSHAQCVDRTCRPLLLEVDPLHHHGAIAAREGVLPMQLLNGSSSTAAVPVGDQATPLQSQRHNTTDSRHATVRTACLWRLGHW
jgi:hypothetical protein